MQLQCTLEDGEAWFSNGEQSAQIRLELLTNPPLKTFAERYGIVLLILGLVIFLGVHSIRMVAPGWRELQMMRRGVTAWNGDLHHRPH